MLSLSTLKSPLSRAAIALTLAVLLLSSNALPPAHAAAGDLDPSFGSGGKVTTDFFGSNDQATTVLQQADGKIIAVGFGSSGARFALARYNTDGSLDPSFGSGGKVLTSFFDRGDLAFAGVLQPDGKIIAAGTATDTNGFLNFGLARYNTNGSLDLSFGTGGKVLTNFPGALSQAFALALQPDGKIVAGGATDIFTPNTNFALARYNADGSLDNTFGTSGKVITDFFGNFDTINALIIQSDGKIVAGGRADLVSNPTNGEFALARYNADGSLDLSFGAGGTVTTDFFGSIDNISGLALQSDGKIVAAGVAFVSNPGDKEVALARYNASGSLDSSFGSGGKVTSTLGSTDSHALAVTLSSGGKILIAGVTSNNFFVAQFNADGSLDSSFGVGGKVIVDFSGSVSFAQDVLVQADGKIVAAGGSGGDFALARLLGADQGAAFDLCIQDDSSDNILRINTTTGEYQFTNCSGFTISGTGSLTKRGSIITFQHTASDRRVMARIDGGVNRATASIQIISQGLNFTIIDRNTANNTCSCR
jgi:uncharacterized delta-60 repeat protein